MSVFRACLPNFFRRADDVINNAEKRPLLKKELYTQSNYTTSVDSFAGSFAEKSGSGYGYSQQPAHHSGMFWTAPKEETRKSVLRLSDDRRKAFYAFEQNLKTANFWDENRGFRYRAGDWLLLNLELEKSTPTTANRKAEARKELSELESEVAQKANQRNQAVP
jgi:hypothetical protein